MASDPKRSVLSLILGSVSDPWANPEAFRWAQEMLGRIRGPESPENQLAERGITRQQRRAYIPGVSELLQSTVAPSADPAVLLESGILEAVGSLKGDASRRTQVRGTPSEDYQSEDAWRLYLGMPQREGSFGISSFTPSRSKDSDAEYFRLNEAWPKILANTGAEFGGRFSELNENPLRTLIHRIDESGGRVQLNGDHFGLTALRNFTLTKGEDENGPYIAYYDVFDLEQPLEGAVGRPFEIYDRLYYDPETMTPITGPNQRRRR